MSREFPQKLNPAGHIGARRLVSTFANRFRNLAIANPRISPERPSLPSGLTLSLSGRASLDVILKP
jgi:hypothetical protein